MPSALGPPHPLAIVLAVSLALGGCLQPNEGDPATPPPMDPPAARPAEAPAAPSPSSPPSSGVATPPPGRPTSLLRFEGTNCVGSGVRASAPIGTFAATLPPGWEASPDQVTSNLNTILYRCERLSWGGFERPAYLLWEGHLGDFVPPEACNEDGTVQYILANQGFDHPGLVAQTRGLGMPSFGAGFNLSLDETPAATAWRWSWTAEGQPESSLTF